MSYTRRVLRGVSIVFLFGLLTNVLGYALRLYLARVLDTSNFGLVYAILGLFGFIMFFVYLGFSEATVKFVSEFHAKKQEKKAIESANSVLFTELALAALVTIIVLLVSERLAIAYFKDAASMLPLRVFALSAILMPFEAFLVKMFQAYQRPVFYSLVQFVRIAVLLVCSYALFTLYPQLGVLAAIIPYPITGIILMLIFYPLFKMKVSKFTLTPKNFNPKLLKKIFLYGVPIALTTLSSGLLTYTDTVTITWFRSLEEVGLYNAALPIANILLFFGGSVITVFFPLVSELWAKKKVNLLENVLAEGYVFLLAIVVPGSVLFFVFADIILDLLFGIQYILAFPALKVLAISSIFATISMFNGSILSGMNMPQLMTKSVVVGALLNLGLNIVLIPRIGFVGAAFATLIAQTFIFIATTHYVRTSVKFTFPWHKLLLTLLAGIALAPLVTWMKDSIPLPFMPRLLIVGTVLGVVYIGALFLMRIITYARIKQLVNEFLGAQA